MLRTLFFKRKVSSGWSHGVILPSATVIWRVPVEFLIPERRNVPAQQRPGGRRRSRTLAFISGPRLTLRLSSFLAAPLPAHAAAARAQAQAGTGSGSGRARRVAAIRFQRGRERGPDRAATAGIGGAWVGSVTSHYV